MKKTHLTLILLITLTLIATVTTATAQTTNTAPQTDIYTYSETKNGALTPIFISVKYVSSPTFNINGTSFGNTPHEEHHVSDPSSGVDSMTFNASNVDTYNITFSCTYNTYVKQTVQVYISELDVNGQTTIQQFEMNSLGFTINILLTTKLPYHGPTLEDIVGGVTNGVTYQMNNNFAQLKSQTADLQDSTSGTQIIGLTGGIAGFAAVFASIIMGMRHGRTEGKRQILKGEN